MLRQNEYDARKMKRKWEDFCEEKKSRCQHLLFGTEEGRS